MYNYISEIMTVPDIFGIPYVTDVKIGKTYGDIIKPTKDASEHEAKKHEFESQIEYDDEQEE